MGKEAESRRKSDCRRKRSYTRKASPSRSFINTAEARREIAHALQIHRQSSKPAVPCSSYCRQLTDSLPVPGPTWSTTAPAVRCGPVPAVDVLEVEWFDDVSSSYSWWLGFLKSLDGKMDGVRELTESENVFEACLDGRGGEKLGLGVGDPNLFTDEWVVFPGFDC